MQVCRICLATDRKMYSLDIDRIRSYEQITGATFVSNDLLPKWICWECGYYLSKYVAFRRKAVTSQHILQGILSSGGLVQECKFNSTSREGKLETQCGYYGKTLHLREAHVQQWQINQTTIGNINRKEFQFLSTLTCTNVKYLCVNAEEENLTDIDADVKKEFDDNDKHSDSLRDHFADDSIADADQDLNNEMLINPIKERDELDTKTFGPTNKGNDFNNECEIINNAFEDNEEYPDKSCNKKSNDKRKRKSTAFEIDLDIDSRDLNEDSKNIESPANQAYLKKKRKNTKAKNNKGTDKKSKEIIKKSQKLFINGKRKKSLRDKGDVQVLDKIDKNILNLTKLSFDEQIAEIERRKLNDNYRKSKFKCTYCFRGFLDHEKLNRHMEKHSESQGAYVCKLCKLRYVAQCKLNLHLKTHLYRISCLQCSFNTGNLNVAIKHQNHHKGKQFICPHCKEIYTHASSYLSHLRIKHPSNVICQYCGHSFINERGLLIHKKYVHRFDQAPIPQDGPYCERCDIRFSSQDALDTHKQLSDKHVDERNLTEDKEQRRKEAKCRSKPTSEPFADGPKPCEQCGEQLHNPRAYFEHFRKEHKDKNRTFFYAKKAHRYMCEICGKMLQNTANLRDHQYVHSETKQFKCERCGRQFQLNAHLRLHQRHHCGTRVPYPCTVCGKVFSNQSNVQRHMVSHTGIRAYKCEMCDKTFAHLGNKKNHVEFVHKKKPWPKRNRGARKRTERQIEMMQPNPCEAANMQQEWNSAS